MPSNFNFESSISEPYPQSNEVVLAVDGSRRGKAHSSAYLASNGLFGIVAGNFSVDRCKPQCALSTELRAAYYGLHKIVDAKVTLLSDNKTTIDWLNRWKDGDEKMPSWYSLDRANYKQASLLKLQGIMASRALDVSVMFVKGHSGDLLNEAADALAGIGSNVVNGVYSSPDGKTRATGLVDSFLRSYHDSW